MNLGVVNRIISTTMRAPDESSVFIDTFVLVLFGSVGVPCEERGKRGSGALHQGKCTYSTRGTYRGDVPFY